MDEPGHKSPSSVGQQGCNRKPSKNAVPKVPSLPKLHCRAPFVTTELSKSIFKSTVGHDFDLSRPIEDEIFTKYNTLHDPHTKALFHRPSMCRKLLKNGFITPNTKVVCSLKEYNSYREFMECELWKRRNKQEKKEKEKQKLEKAEVKDKVVNPVDKEREEKRQRFFQEQDRRLVKRQKQMRQVQRREQEERLKAMEEKKLMQERNEIRREAEREQRRLTKVQQEHQEAVEKRHQLQSSENQMLVRMLQLQHSRQSHRLQQIQALESKWQAYDDHVRKAREKEEEVKVRAREEKERKRKRRKKLVELMKAKKEERRKKLHEETFHHAEELKKQADQHEKIWREKKEHEVVAWRDKIHREQDHWQHHIHHQMEVCKNEHKKQMDSLLHKSYLPNCAKSHPTARPVGSSMSSKCSNDTTQHSIKSKGTPKPRKKGVHFQQTASIHIIEEDEADFEDAVEPTDSVKNNSEHEHSTVDVDRAEETSSKADDKVETDVSQMVSVKEDSSASDP